MEQKEARKVEGLDDPQLLLKARLRRPPQLSWPALVSILEALLAQLAESPHRPCVLSHGVPVSQVAAQIEPQPVGQRDRLGNGTGVLWEARRHRLR